MANNTKVFKLSDRTRNKEGRNIDIAFLDESHEMKDNIIGKSIEQSQSLKDNPLFIDITTEGFVIDGYLDEELKKAMQPAIIIESIANYVIPMTLSSLAHCLDLSTIVIFLNLLT